jgi:hypothetical protein
MNLWRYGAMAVSTAIVFLLAGCGSTRPPAGNVMCQPSLDKYVVPSSTVILKRIQERSRQLQMRLRSSGAARIPANIVLALTAGGQFGAYGAGFIEGWAEHDAHDTTGLRRRDIAVVTGVSTGAIMATLVYLGRDAETVEIYEHLRASDVFTPRPLLSLITANSLLDTSAKDAMIASRIDAQMLRDVAIEADKSARGLYLGITNLDTGQFQIVDMVALARSGDLACYRAVVGASSAIPVAFAPKFIDGWMYVDGGARWHTFLVPPTASSASSLALTAADYAHVHVVGIVHSELKVTCQSRSDEGNGGKTNGVLQIAQRMAHLATDSGMKASIRALEDEAVNKQFSTHYAPASAAFEACRKNLEQCSTSNDVGSDDAFCPAFEECLIERGKEDGRSLRLLDFNSMQLGTDPDCLQQSLPASRRLIP